MMLNYGFISENKTWSFSNSDFQKFQELGLGVFDAPTNGLIQL